jgi:hypothetical protein
MELVKGVLPYVLPIVLATVTAVLSPALVTPRKLRHDLAADTGMLEDVPRRARPELREDVERRTFLLVSLSRYPSLTLFDLLSLLGLAAVCTGAVVGVVQMHESPELVASSLPVPIAIYAFASGCWTAFYLPWTTRADGRLSYIERHLGIEEARHAAKTLRVAHATALLSGVVALAGPLVAYSLVAYQNVGMDDWGSWVMPLLAAVFGLATIGVTTHGNGLSRRLLRLSDLAKVLMEDTGERAKGRSNGGLDDARRASRPREGQLGTPADSTRAAR